MLKKINAKIENSKKARVEKNVAKTMTDKVATRFNKINKLFQEVGGIEVVLDLHEKILNQVNVDVRFYAGEDSQSMNYLYFCFLKLQGFNPKSILEIGTYYGVTANYLSLLYPESTVYTCELPANHPRYMYFCGGKEEFEKKELMIARNTKRSNIISIRNTSSRILFEKIDDVDLVWLDGDHRNPFMFLDLYNAYFLLKKQANKKKVLMIDDVFLEDDIAEYLNAKIYTNEDDAIKSIRYFVDDNQNVEPVFLPRNLDREKYKITPRNIAILEFQ